MMKNRLIIGNWKMHGSLATNAILLQALRNAAALPHCQIAVCVPYPYLAQCQQILTGSAVAWGAQDVAVQAQQGAFTGDVCAAMLTDFACRYVLVGHSERRMHHHESDAMIAAKVANICAAGMTPVLCLGETWTQREAGQTDTIVSGQLNAVLDQLPSAYLNQLILAYEPIWAIGTGKIASSLEAQTVHAVLRSEIAKRDSALAQTTAILYGGSVKPDNACELLNMPDIDGGLIGGASLKAEDFLRISAA